MLRIYAFLLMLTLLPGCDILAGLFYTRAVPVDPSEVMHDAAMADFSTCQTAPDPVERAAAAARLAAAAAQMQTMDRPANPDHFHMMDRVVSASEFCAAAQ